MKASIMQDELKSALRDVGQVIPKRSTLPVLECVLIQAEHGHITLTGTDLESVRQQKRAANVEREGMICVPFKQFGAIVRNLSPERVDLELSSKDNPDLIITCGSQVNTLHTISGDEYPKIDDVLAYREEIPYLGWLASHVSPDDTRPTLTTIHVQDGRACAADGYALAYTPADVAPGFYTRKGDKHAGTWMGEYPDVDQIIRTSHVAELTIDAADFMRGLKRLDVIARHKQGAVTLYLKDGVLHGIAEADRDDMLNSWSVVAEGQDTLASNYDCRRLLHAVTEWTKKAHKVTDLRLRFSPLSARSEDKYRYILTLEPVGIADTGVVLMPMSTSIFQAILDEWAAAMVASFTPASYHAAAQGEQRKQAEKQASARILAGEREINRKEIKAGREARTKLAQMQTRKPYVTRVERCTAVDTGLAHGPHLLMLSSRTIGAQYITRNVAAPPASVLLGVSPAGAPIYGQPGDAPPA